MFLSGLKFALGFIVGMSILSGVSVLAMVGVGQFVAWRERRQRRLPAAKARTWQQQIMPKISERAATTISNTFTYVSIVAAPSEEKSFPVGPLTRAFTLVRSVDSTVLSISKYVRSMSPAKAGKARHIPLNTIALQALQERKLAQQDYRAKQKEKGADLGEPVYVFRDADEDPQHNYRRGVGSTRLCQKPRSKTTPGIATGIRLQVGWLWRGLTFARLPN